MSQTVLECNKKCKIHEKTFNLDYLGTALSAPTRANALSAGSRRYLVRRAAAKCFTHHVRPVYPNTYGSWEIELLSVHKRLICLRQIYLQQKAIYLKI